MEPSRTKGAAGPGPELSNFRTPRNDPAAPHPAAAIRARRLSLFPNRFEPIRSVHHQMVTCRKQRQLDPIRDAQRVENIRQVVLDRVFTDRELLRDFLVWAAGYHSGDHLHLTRREIEVPAGRSRLGLMRLADRLDQ